MNILFVCTGNSCRSQTAESILKSLKPEFEVYSAGIKPEKEISPYAVKVLAEKGIDISGQYPKSIDVFENRKFDFLITLSESADKGCKNINAKKKLHFDIEDPFEAKGSEYEITEKYREVSDEIMQKISEIFEV
ncbi:MAG: arsenate reductase ArsC [Bacteroidales bacterium]|nr:arsenate reductase ArsC [Bacteroidales bacterium]